MLCYGVMLVCYVIQLPNLGSCVVVFALLTRSLDVHLVYFPL
jgi:hypothetical protein